MGALEEIEAIKQLAARYFRLMDTKQWEAWAGGRIEWAHSQCREGESLPPYASWVGSAGASSP